MSKFARCPIYKINHKLQTKNGKLIDKQDYIVPNDLVISPNQKHL